MNNKKENLVEHLYLYYLDILKEGNDTRNEGLSWIVKEIFYLGKNALISYFPKYLDDISIQYIINQAKLNILMENYENQIKKIRNDLINLNLFKKSNKKLFQLKLNLINLEKKDENKINTEDNNNNTKNEISLKKDLSENSFIINI